MKERFARIAALMICLAAGTLAARMLPAHALKVPWDLGMELRSGEPRDSTNPPLPGEDRGPALAPDSTVPLEAGPESPPPASVDPASPADSSPNDAEPAIANPAGVASSLGPSGEPTLAPPRPPGRPMDARPGNVIVVNVEVAAEKSPR